MLIGIPAAHAQMRFQGMDRNHDGVITRNEWRGSDQSFRTHDWNHDGVLSGDEVRPGAQRNAVRNGSFTNEQIAQRFNVFDRDGSGRITEDEWRARSGDMRMFAQMDANHDRTITVEEFTNGGGLRLNEGVAINQGGPRNDFASFDRNGNGWITRNEWNLGAAEFNRLDTNRDNRISAYEFRNYSLAPNSNRTVNRRSRADQAGYDRGLAEGREAGRGDYVQKHGWDLEGQTELEGANSGYDPQLGPLAEYQHGYREGFRIGYREGFNQH
jgi:Ca2+-binding EF-hand superfamily protein